MACDFNSHIETGGLLRVTSKLYK